jgi:hypothetical protein
MHAVYDKACLPYIAERLVAGRLRSSTSSSACA